MKLVLACCLAQREKTNQQTPQIKSNVYLVTLHMNNNFKKNTVLKVIHRKSFDFAASYIWQGLTVWSVGVHVEIFRHGFNKTSWSCFLQWYIIFNSWSFKRRILQRNLYFRLGDGHPLGSDIYIQFWQDQQSFLTLDPDSKWSWLLTPPPISTPFSALTSNAVKRLRRFPV